MEVNPRAEDPGDGPDEPDLTGTTPEERAETWVEYKMNLDKYSRDRNEYVPQLERFWMLQIK